MCTLKNLEKFEKPGKFLEKMSGNHVIEIAN